MGWATGLQCLGDEDVGGMKRPPRKSSSPGKAAQGRG